MGNWRRLGVALAIVLTIILTGTVYASIKPKVSAKTSGGICALIINGKPAVRFAKGNGNLTAAQRAQITSDRLSQLVDLRLDPATIYVRSDKHAARIYVGETMLCIATAADAKHSGATPAELANSWMSNIKSLLMMPAIILNPKDLVVPVGETRRVEITGAAVGPVYAKTDNEDIAIAVPATDGKYITVMGKKLGAVQIDVSMEGEHMILPVSIKKYAGSMPTIAIAEVTGNPCPAQLACYAARQAVAQNAQLEPGSTLEVGRVLCSNQPLGRGQVRQMRAEVRISGPNLIPFFTRANVEVHNIVLPSEDVQELFYSNDPERIQKYQTLFAGKLQPDTATRILYHHQNMMGKRVHLIVEVINPSDQPTKVRVFRGISAPSVDTVAVGHIAGSAFLKECQNDVSVLEIIPPQSRLVLVSDILGNKETASGILQVHQMSGGDGYVRITAAEPYVDNVERGTIARAPSILSLPLSDDIYPAPIKTVNAEYVVGSRWAFIPIGQDPLSTDGSQKKLYGNYGVTYNINVRISNPTGEPKKVIFAFDPTAGIASGVFLIDGKFTMARSAQPPSDVPLASYTVQPGETRSFRVVTVPLAGSNYPATLVVRS